jgi:DnaJ-class molecular chaperone
MKPKKDEQVCLVCDGAGTMENRGVAWELRVCPGCNGHGVVVYDKYAHKVVAFDMEAETAAKIAEIGPAR